MPPPDHSQPGTWWQYPVNRLEVHLVRRRHIIHLHLELLQSIRLSPGCNVVVSDSVYSLCLYYCNGLRVPFVFSPLSWLSSQSPGPYSANIVTSTLSVIRSTEDITLTFSQYTGTRGYLGQVAPKALCPVCQYKDRDTRDTNLINSFLALKNNWFTPNYSQFPSGLLLTDSPAAKMVDTRHIQCSARVPD